MNMYTRMWKGGFDSRGKIFARHIFISIMILFRIKRNAYVYCVKRSVGGKQYVGLTTKALSVIYLLYPFNNYHFSDHEGPNVKGDREGPTLKEEK